MDRGEQWIARHSPRIGEGTLTWSRRGPQPIPSGCRRCAQLFLSGAPMIGDVTLDALRVGLNGLNMRRAASADAVANMETPGYRANRVAFEDQLADALEHGDVASVRPSVSQTTDAALPNGNNVQVDQELMGLSDTELRQQLLVEAVNAKFRLLRTVIVG